MDGNEATPLFKANLSDGTARCDRVCTPIYSSCCYAKLTCLTGRPGVTGFPKKNDVCDVCLLMGLMSEGRCGTKGGGIWSPGLVAARPSILLSSVVGERAGRGLLMAGSSPPLPSGTPLKLSPTNSIQWTPSNTDQANCPD